MKHIAITQRLVHHAEYDEIRDCLDVRWAELLKTLGCLPVVLPSAYPPGDFLGETSVDGVIISGGNDLSAVTPDDALSASRDRYETALLRSALDRGIPLLGVCRGAQLLAGFFGTSVTPVSGHVGVRHAVSPNPRAASAGRCSRSGLVNSYHQYGMHRVLPPLVAMLTAVDGTIEAFTHESLPVFGIMWHPEREKPFSEDDLSFIDAIFADTNGLPP